MKKVLNFIIALLILFVGKSKLDAQQVSSLKTKYCTITGKISDTSLLNQMINVSVITIGNANVIDSTKRYLYKNYQNQIFTFNFPKSDSTDVYFLLFKVENNELFNPFGTLLVIHTEDSIFVDVVKKEGIINLLFKDNDNIVINNIFDAIKLNFEKSFVGGGNQDSLKALFFKDIIKLIDKFPEAGLSAIWQYRRVAFTDSLGNTFMKVLYEKIDSLSNAKFKHPIIDVLNSEIRPNRAALDFWAISIDSIPLSINRYKGNYCLIDFWASWCGPCRKKNQELKQYYQELSSNGLKILSISIDEHKGLWKRAVFEDDLPWDSAWIADKKQKEIIDNFYRIDSIPTTILIDPNGNVIDINPSLKQIKNALRK